MSSAFSSVFSRIFYRSAFLTTLCVFAVDSYWVAAVFISLLFFQTYQLSYPHNLISPLCLLTVNLFVFLEVDSSLTALIPLLSIVVIQMAIKNQKSSRGENEATGLWEIICIGFVVFFALVSSPVLLIELSASFFSLLCLVFAVHPVRQKIFFLVIATSMIFLTWRERIPKSDLFSAYERNKPSLFGLWTPKRLEVRGESNFHDSGLLLYQSLQGNFLLAGYESWLSDGGRQVQNPNIHPIRFFSDLIKSTNKFKNESNDELVVASLVTPEICELFADENIKFVQRYVGRDLSTCRIQNAQSSNRHMLVFKPERAIENEFLSRQKTLFNDGTWMHFECTVAFRPRRSLDPKRRIDQAIKNSQSSDQVWMRFGKNMFCEGEIGPAMAKSMDLSRKILQRYFGMDDLNDD